MILIKAHFTGTQDQFEQELENQGIVGSDAIMDTTTATIKSEVQYQAALQKLESLMEFEPETGSREAVQLELLGQLLEEYESRHFGSKMPRHFGFWVDIDSE
jgi:hypothetical protein